MLWSKVFNKFRQISNQIMNNHLQFNDLEALPLFILLYVRAVKVFIINEGVPSFFYKYVVLTLFEFSATLKPVGILRFTPMYINKLTVCKPKLRFNVVKVLWILFSIHRSEMLHVCTLVYSADPYRYVIHVTCNKTMISYKALLL